MKFICLTLLLVSGITDSRSEQFEVVGPADPVFAVAGEDVILPCSVKPSISVVDMRVEWLRTDVNSPIVHLYDDHEDRNTEQIQSYRERTKLILQELQRGNASLKLSTVRVSDEGRYKCFIQSKSCFDEATFDVRVEAVGRPPVITVYGFDGSGGFHLQCESEGWNPEPHLEWLDSEGVRLSSETTETHRNTDGFSVKHTITVYGSGKFHCRVKLRHHMLETRIITTTDNRFISWRTSVILVSVFVVLIGVSGILIAVFAHKNREISFERDQLLHSQKIILPKALPHLRTHTAVKVTLDADSAHPLLIVSDDGKQVRDENGLYAVAAGEHRFNDYLGVLGKDGYSSGSFYFEVKVKGQTWWDLGVARESSNRSGRLGLSPDVGYWTVRRRVKRYWCVRRCWTVRFNRYWALESPRSVPLSLREDPQRIGVFVDYDEGLVSFYELESMTHIYTFTGQSFNDKLFPFVGFGYHWEYNLRNNNSTPLIICDDY